MKSASPRLTFIFQEIIKAAKAGDVESARSLAGLLPPRTTMGPMALRLQDAISEFYRIPIQHDQALASMSGLKERETGFWPKISVITPSFNQGKYIRETITSVLNQGYPNLEYIVIDGGSTDETVSVIKEYANRISHWVSEKDRGQSNAINKGFKVATGEIMTWLNSDDQFAENALFHMALAFKTSGADMVAGICEVFENDVLKHRHITSCLPGELPIDALLDLERGWNAGQFFFQPEVFFTRSLWDRAGAHVREDCYYSMDYELWCRFAAAGARLHTIGTPIVKFRSHPEQKTADPEKFKAELVPVQYKFVDEWLQGTAPSLIRPAPDHSKSVKVAMINDHGFKYGAGIAHQRIAASMDMAGFHVHALAVKDYLANPDDLNDPGGVIKELLADLSAIEPDIVIFGNLHSQWKKEPDLVFAIQEKYRTFWITHDFWLFTGRCPYVGGCDKYLSGCDEKCPTADHYPALPPQEIAGAWRRKRRALAECDQLTILANSTWSQNFSKRALGAFDNRIAVEKITLGVPTFQYIRSSKPEAKKRLKIPADHFTIAFSVSSISEKRKGADILEAAIHMLDSQNITLLLIGNCDEPIDLPSANVVKLGYVESHHVLVDAMNAADVFVGPSREETLGQVFLEAAMCGTPSIGFAGSGVEDAIVHGVTGILVQEQSAVHMAAAIKGLMTNRDYCRHLANTAYLHARSHFSLEASFKSFFEVLKRQGLVDQWCLPHKISFKKDSAILTKGNAGWFPLKGMSMPEGPYPEHGIDTEFRWCHGTESSFEVRDHDAKEAILVFKNTIFDHQTLRIQVNDSEAVVISLRRGEEAEARLDLSASDRYANKIHIFPEHHIKEPDAGKRYLSVMLFDVRLGC